MTISVDVPHNLGAAEARRRIENGTDQLLGRLPAGATARPHWAGNRLQLDIAALGQEVKASLDVQDKLVRVEVALPPALSFMRPLIEAVIRRTGTELLEDRSGR